MLERQTGRAHLLPMLGKKPIGILGESGYIRREVGGEKKDR